MGCGYTCNDMIAGLRQSVRDGIVCCTNELSRTNEGWYLRVNPTWVAHEGFAIDVSRERSHVQRSDAEQMRTSVRYRRTGDRFVYCPRDPGEVECSNGRRQRSDGG